MKQTIKLQSFDGDYISTIPMNKIEMHEYITNKKRWVKKALRKAA
jgi:hypothetical protein